MRPQGGRNLSWHRLQRLGGEFHQPISSNWAVGGQKPTACLLACCCVTSFEHPWFRVINSGHQLGDILIPSKYALTHFLCHLIGSGIVWCVGGSLLVAGLVDEAVSDLGVAPLAVVEHCWSLCLLGMVILGHTGRHVAVGVGKLWASHNSSVAPSAYSWKPAKLVGNCHGLPRSSWLRRLNHTCFCIGLLGEHTTADSCSDCEHISVHVRVVPSQVGLTSSPGDSCGCSCSRGQPEEQCSHSSLC